MHVIQQSKNLFSKSFTIYVFEQRHKLIVVELSSISYTTVYLPAEKLKPYGQSN